MLYIRILEQKEILCLRHVLVLVSLTGQCLCHCRQKMVHIPQIIDTLSRVSVIKRLSLYTFAPKGRDFMSVARIREGPYYRGFFLEEMYENFVGT